MTLSNMSLIKGLLVILITVLAMVYSVITITKQSASEKVGYKFKEHAIIKPKNAFNDRHALNAKMLAPKSNVKQSPNSIKNKRLSRREVL